jgi:flagellar hook-length control protein FliK
MRLPGLGQLTNEAAPNQNGADAPGDPAQAFDAVMSRFSNERTARPEQNKAADAANSAGRPAAKTPPAANGRSAPASGQPVARSKPKDADEGNEDAAAEADTTDATALVASVAESVQLAAQNTAQAAGADGATPAATKDAKGDAAISAVALDVLAGQANAIAGRGAEKISADARTPIAGEEDATPASTGTSPNRRAPIAAKDTLRIDAPLTRPFDATRADVAQRVAEVANTITKATLNASAAPSTEATSQAIAAAVAGNSNTPATYSIAHTAVASPVGSAGFANELSQRVVVFAGQKVQRAEISVTPADLGPIAVSIEVRGQEATLAFAASSHATRAAIEDALPRLRDMLSAQGLQLAGTHVGSEPRRDPYRPGRGEKGVAGVNGVHPGAATNVSASSAAEIRRSMNLIDIVV